MDAPSCGAAEGDLARILGISRAFKASKALNLSTKLGLYTLLAQHPDGLTWQEVASHLGWRVHEGSRGATDFLDVLVSISMLLREGDGLGAR